MVNVAVTCEALETTLLIVMPEMALMDPPARFDPARITFTVAPWVPLDGVIEVSVGSGGPLVGGKAATATAFSL